LKKPETNITQADSEDDSGSEHRLSLENERPVLVESVLEFSDATQPDGLEYQLFEDPIDIPEDSVVETESSDGQGHVGHIYEEESDGDHEKDEDYVMDDDKSDGLDSDEEFYLSDVHHEPTKGKGKAIKVSPFFPLFFSYWSLGY
jgi:hypothetical protein